MMHHAHHAQMQAPEGNLHLDGFGAPNLGGVPTEADDSMLTPSKKRGRPKGQKDKNPFNENGEKKKRGRPKGSKDGPRDPEAPRRGRPPKHGKDDVAKLAHASAGMDGSVPPAKKPRGRKPKNARTLEAAEEVEVQNMAFNDLGVNFQFPSDLSQYGQIDYRQAGNNGAAAGNQDFVNMMGQAQHHPQQQHQVPQLGSSSRRSAVPSTGQEFLEQRFGCSLQELLMVNEPHLSEMRRLVAESKQHREAQQQHQPQIPQIQQQRQPRDARAPAGNGTPAPPMSLNGN